MTKMMTRRNSCGFTLVEIVMVILLLGIIAAIAVPRFSDSLADLQAAAIARQIAQDIATVRRVARVTSTTKSISFDSADQTYTLNGVSNPDRRSDAYVVSITTHAPQATFGVINLGGDALLTFNGFGLPDSGGTIDVQVGQATKQVVIDAVTGSATVP